MVKRQERLAAKSAELAQLSANHGELTNELSRVNLQKVVGTTVSDDLKSVVGAYERPAKRVKMTRQCEDSSTTPWQRRFWLCWLKGMIFRINVKR